MNLLKPGGSGKPALDVATGFASSSARGERMVLLPTSCCRAVLRSTASAGWGVPLPPNAKPWSFGGVGVAWACALPSPARQGMDPPPVPCLPHMFTNQHNDRALVLGALFHPHFLFHGAFSVTRQSFLAHAVNRRKRS